MRVTLNGSTGGRGRAGEPFLLCVRLVIIGELSDNCEEAMSIRLSRLLATAFILFCFVSSASAVTVQGPEDVLPDGSAFLFVEAEDVSEIGGADPSLAWVKVDKHNPIQTINEPTTVKGGLDVLPADTNASGGAALLDQLGGGGTATWELQFAIPATYSLYFHYTFYNRDDNTHYGNEDSVYLPPSFNAHPRDDWIGFEGVDQNGSPKTGDSNRDGWMPLAKDIVSEGLVETHNSTDEDFWEGQFHWGWLSVAVDMDENNAFLSDFGHGIQYEVAEGDVGTVLDFQISTREAYGVIDALLFSTSSELLEDFSQEQMDEFFIQEEAPVALQAGDADQDLDFDQFDLIQTQVAAKYLTGQAATWGEGDWNGAPGGSVGSPPAGDGVFDQFDIIASQQAGLYLQGPYAAIGSGGNSDDEQTSIVYDPSTGELGVNAPASTELTSINIDSAAGVFTGDPAQNLGGSFDNDSDNNIFKATFGSSFGSLSFGNVAQAGLTEEFVLSDLTVVGSLAGGGDLGTVDLMYVPEPSACVLAMIGVLSLLGYYRRQCGQNAL